MKKFSFFVFKLFLILAVLIFIGCGSESSNTQGTVKISFDYSLPYYINQTVATDLPATMMDDFTIAMDFSADQIMTGTLVAYNVDTGDAESFDWSVYLDENTLEVESNKTIILTPGTYNFSLLLTKGAHQYGGTAFLKTVVDGENTIPLTIRPIIGDTVKEVTVISRLADFRFKYDPEELSGFTDPQIGITINGGAEMIFAVSPETGLSKNMFLNLVPGTYTIQLKFYDCSIQRGKSVPEQETVLVVPGEDLTMDLVALHAETVFYLTEAGGTAVFRFVIPAEVVDEAGGLSNLRVLFSVVGDENPLQQEILSLTQSGDDYFAEVFLDGMQYGDVTVSLVFSDIGTSPHELLGICAQKVTLDAEPRSEVCELVLRRRAVIGGNLLATLGVNVFNEEMEPVAGAVVFANGKIVGITGSGTFGTKGYLKVFLVADDYTIRALGSRKGGEEEVSLKPLSVNNVDIILDTGVLIVYHDYTDTRADEAVTELGMIPIKAGRSDFNSLFDAGGFEVIVWDSPMNWPPTEALDRLSSWIESGGRLIFSWWDLDINAAFQADLGVSVAASYHYFREVHHDPSSPVNFFQMVETFPSPMLGIDWYFNDNGDELVVTDPGGFLAARLDSPTGPGAIAVTHSGRVIVNGFLPADMLKPGYETDGDADGVADIQELYMNQIIYVFSQ